MAELLLFVLLDYFPLSYFLFCFFKLELFHYGLLNNNHSKAQTDLLDIFLIFHTVFKESAGAYRWEISTA